MGSNEAMIDNYLDWYFRDEYEDENNDTNERKEDDVQGNSKAK